MMQSRLLFALLISLVLVVPSLSRAQAPPLNKYDENTIRVSWLVIEFLSRCVRKEPLKNPGAPILRNLFATTVKKGMGESMAYLEIRFRPGSERAQYKMANDPSASAVRPAWTVQQVKQVAGLVDILLNSHETKSKPMPSDVAAAWELMKKVSVDPYMPDEDAAEVAARFLELLERKGLDNLDDSTKGEILDFKGKFRPVFRRHFPKVRLDDFDIDDLKIKPRDMSRFQNFRQDLTAGRP